MKKFIHVILLISLVLLVSCTATGPKQSECPYLKMKRQCESGSSASCNKASTLKEDFEKNGCPSKSCGSSCGGKSCGSSCGSKSTAKSCS